jgi:hypothetical protein
MKKRFPGVWFEREGRMLLGAFLLHFRQTVMRQLVFLLLTLAGLSCARLPPPEDRANLQAQLRTVVVEDGISVQEADIIAQSYFYHFGPGCGVTQSVTDGGSSWISNTLVGYAAAPTREPIRIDKKTGRVTWSDGPTVEDPKNIFNEKNSWNSTR